MTAAAASQKGLSLAGQAFFGSLCVGTFGLGVWQTQRYFEKVNLVAKRQKDLAEEPIQPSNYQQDLQSGTGSFRRYQLRGRWDHEHELLVGPRGPPPGALPDKPGSSAAGMAAAPQGYHVITPLRVEDSNQVVLVNRGWVPRQYVVQDRNHRRQYPKQQQQQTGPLLQWDRPQTVSSVTVVPTKFETPKSFMIVQHDFEEKPPRLFWLDPMAMHAAGGLPFPEQEGDRTPLVTAVKEEQSENDDKHNDKSLTLPLPPSAQKVGDFHVTPATHVGYGLTWYGLSAAGIVMTRKLMMRGRGG